jgi:hypothetical protein
MYIMKSFITCTVRMIMKRRIRWAGHVVQMLGKPEETIRKM